ncbi:hypothetical protein FQU76_16035 [Streptomyces qinzhouensis]|uniref:Uncharacterized protein n=1 Tax=Streptomyces qinzhouensis TaxID=2599401 RepID=A0A5B8JBH1_9ACTN|nr:hypothetical protein [Streptomyces qinzhouensis]QDY77764.1 hypothetical protein FQU76_16035 [Streptomyces qinzhouensis]
MNLRMVGISSVVVAAALVPLAAVAGEGRVPDRSGLVRAQDGRPPGTGRPPAVSGTTGESGRRDPGAGPSRNSAGNRPSRGHTAAPGVTNTAGPAGGVSPGAASAAGAVGATRARCGPELSSPDGVEAQTCVLTDGRATWARTYYRNATGAELTSVLTLMGPARRTLQMNCVVEAGDEPGVCETPKVSSRGLRGYFAVAEFAAVEEASPVAGGGPGQGSRHAQGVPAGDRGDGPLLLRSGSNSVDPAGH